MHAKRVKERRNTVNARTRITLTAISLSFLTEVASIARRNRRLSTKSVAGIVMFFTLVKPKKKLHDIESEHLKALTQVGHASAVADHSTSTGHNIKWDHFEILASSQCDLQCKGITVNTRQNPP